MPLSKTDLLSIFDTQVANLLHKRYPSLAQVSQMAFLDHITPLRSKLESLLLPNIDIDNGTLPFVIVVKQTLVSTDKAMAVVDRNGKSGVTKLFPLNPQDFNPIETVDIPESLAYLLLDIDRGKLFLNIRPHDALPQIVGLGRSPLTIDEGVAIITHYPNFLLKNNGFSLLASRHSGDKRVPALWINATKQPNLGWCWDGNPHTWLGSASCKERLGFSM